METFLEHYYVVGFAVLEDQLLLEVHERIAGIILAAGGSTRFGTPKQLLDWGGVPLVKHAADTALAGGLNPVLVVTGSDQGQVREALEGVPVEIISNPDWGQGQGTSVRAGIHALPSWIGAVLFLLVDQPFITPDLILKIRRAQAIRGAKIILPQVNGEQANPVLFDRVLFNELAKLEGDAGGRALFERFDPSPINWSDEKIRWDIDTPEDYQQLLDQRK
jgi:molybdenum cofactor cytidylyltransferase